MCSIVCSNKEKFPQCDGFLNISVNKMSAFISNWDPDLFKHITTQLEKRPIKSHFPFYDEKVMKSKHSAKKHNPLETHNFL